MTPLKHKPLIEAAKTGRGEAMSVFGNVAWAEQQKCGSPLEKLLLITLAGQADRTGLCEADYIKLAEFCCCSVEVLADAAEDLRRRRLIWIMASGPDAADIAMPWWRGGLGASLEEENPEFPLPLRELLFECQRGLCWYCGCDLETHPLTPHIEHQVPLSRGGPDNISNLVLACAPCNGAKHDKTVSEFRKYIIQRDRKPKDYRFRWEGGGA